jgi:hypothetical protein
MRRCAIVGTSANVSSINLRPVFCLLVVRNSARSTLVPGMVVVTAVFIGWLGFVVEAAIQPAQRAALERFFVQTGGATGWWTGWHADGTCEATGPGWTGGLAGR